MRKLDISLEYVAGKTRDKNKNYIPGNSHKIKAEAKIRFHDISKEEKNIIKKNLNYETKSKDEMKNLNDYFTSFGFNYIEKNKNIQYPDKIFYKDYLEHGPREWIVIRKPTLKLGVDIKYGANFKPSLTDLERMLDLDNIKDFLLSGKLSEKK